MELRMNVGFASVLCVCLYSKWAFSQDSSNGIAMIRDGLRMADMPHKEEQDSVTKQESWTKRVFPLDYLKNEPPKEYVESMEKQFMEYVQAHVKEIKKNWDTDKNAVDNFWSAMRIPARFGKFIKTMGQTNLNKLGTFPTTPVQEAYVVGTTWNIRLQNWKVSAYALHFNDPSWRKQWYVQDYRTRMGPVMDLNVVPVYKMGYTGKGVTVAVVDQGMEHDHPDLEANFDQSLSYDVCQDQLGSLAPEKNKMKETHGIKCAGVIGMKADNNICGVGIAHEATIVGIRMLCQGSQTGDTMAKGLVHNLKFIDIYSNSWGPPDDPWRVCKLNHLTEEAYVRGVTKGRDGKGVIYTQCAGNGGDLGDICSTDCNINRPEVIAIGGADQFGKKCGFSERCTAVFAVTYSGSRFSGLIGAKDGVVATTPGGGCINTFSGTSAATPMASSIIALVLQAKKELTYRDVMHLIAMSAEVAPLANNRRSWYQNARGFVVSNDFGFGLMNAENMVRLAKENWVTVPKKRSCIFTVKVDPPQKFSKKQKAIIDFDTDACASSISDAIQYLEHIEVASTVKFGLRGDILIDIISAAGTRSKLLERRKKDKATGGLRGLSIMSVHNWGEDPRGKWYIEVYIDPSSKSSWVGYVYEFTIKFHGTYEMPNHYKYPRTYASFRTPEGLTKTY